MSQALSMVLQEEQQKEIRNAAAPHQIEMDSTAFQSQQKPQPSYNKTLNNTPHSQHGFQGFPHYSQAYHNASGSRRTSV